jgi:dTDP-glucose 4,6-dehydratase
MKNILVTGGHGFIGFNFIVKLMQIGNKNDIDLVINVDNNTYAGKYRLKEKQQILRQYDNYKHYKYNITDKKKIEKLIKKYGITHIVNFAAETHVDNSIATPEIFVESNIVGVQTLLELCRKYNIRFHQVSTDEVYGSVDPIKDVVDENFLLNPSSPYSASKTGADLLIQSYVKTFGINATISRCTNNYGPWQHPEKLIPKVITNALNDKEIPVYGNGLQMRNWIYVLDHCDAILKIVNDDEHPGEIFNVGSKTLTTNLDVITLILTLLNKPESLITYVKDRPAHDLCYHLCSNKICAVFNWNEHHDFSKGLVETINFYKER